MRDVDPTRGALISFITTNQEAVAGFTLEQSSATFAEASWLMQRIWDIYRGPRNAEDAAAKQNVGQASAACIDAC